MSIKVKMMREMFWACSATKRHLWNQVLGISLAMYMKRGLLQRHAQVESSSSAGPLYELSVFGTHLGPCTYIGESPGSIVSM